MTLCSSRYAFEEARINLANEDRRTYLNQLSGAIHWFEAAQRPFPHSLPEKNAPILLAAIEARATHLLTGDVGHFGPYWGKKIQGAAIVLLGHASGTAFTIEPILLLEG